jgi:hypothetical protein
VNAYPGLQYPAPRDYYASTTRRQDSFFATSYQKARGCGTPQKSASSP